MYAKVTQIQFHSGSETEALQFIREVMFPSASMQPGFKDAYILQSTTQLEKYTLISVWASLEEMLVSGPPAQLREGMKHFGTLTLHAEQDIQQIHFHFAETTPPDEN